MSGSTAGILTEPRIPQPQQSRDVVGLVLQNTGSAALPAREITFGQVFAPGQVPAGSQLLASIGGKQIPVQMDVKTTNPDGSVRMAVLTMEQPALVANSSTNVMLSLAPAGTTVSPALDLAQAIGAGYNVAANLTLHNADGSTTPYSFNVASLLQQALKNGTATYWLLGPQAVEASFSVPVSNSLRLVFNVTAYADGSFATDLQFNNDIAMQPSGGAVTYDATILQNSQVVSQYSNLTQYQYQDWHQVVYSNGAPQVNVQHDITALEKTGAIQNYDLTTGVSSSLLPAAESLMSGSGWDTPLAANGVVQYMPMVGGRPDIGPTTEGNTAWLLSQNQTLAQAALGQADAAGAVPWHYYDPSEGSYIKVTAIPNIWSDPRATPPGTIPLTQQGDTASGWTPEAAHQPDLSFDAYLMTGNQYYLDQLNAQASFDEAAYWPDPTYGRDNAQGLLVTSAQQVRGMAWSMRQIDEAAYANPAGSAEKAYFTQMENNNWSWLVSQIPAWTAEEGQAYGWIPNSYDQYTPPWEQDYFASTAAQAAEMGNQNAKIFLNWETHFLAGRFLNAANGFSPYDGFAYSIVVTNSSLTPYTTWAQIEQATEAAGYSDNGSIPVGDYAALSLMGLAGDITATASPLAMKAYGWVYATTYGSGFLSQDPWFTGNTSVANSDLAFNIVPRLPDGNSLTAADVHLFNSATAGTLAASGADQLIYDLGSANDTIVGGSGTNLLFAGSGNDLLIGNGTDNFLFGGKGADTLTGAAGTNYLDAGSGATTIVLTAAVSATDTIADFKLGTDLLSITDSSGQPLAAAEIQALIAGATAAAGGAVLHLSPEHTVTLEKVSVASLTPSMFVSNSAPASSTIAGAVFNDPNNDGVWESGESAAAGIAVHLIAGGVVEATTTTAANGAYSFGNLTPGTYTVQFVAPPGEPFSLRGASTTLPDSVVNSSGAVTLTLGNGQTISGQDAGLDPPARISGAAFNDPDGDGIWQSGESAASGITVDLIAGGTVEATTTTAANGAYSFGNLTPGTYTVQFVAPSGEAFALRGASTTLPDSVVNSSGAVTVNLAEGQTLSGEDAGLYEPSQPHLFRLTTSGNNIQGASGQLIVEDSAGGNRISSGIGGLFLWATAGSDTVTTAVGATDFLIVANGGGLSGATVINSNGTDTVSVTGRTAEVNAKGPSILVTETNATIHMTEAAGGQHSTATVQGGAATLSGGLGQSGISIIASNGTKVRLASNLAPLKSSAALDASGRPDTIAGGASGLCVTAGTGNFTLRGGLSGDIVQIGAGATVHGGTGQTLYEFVKGAAGGVDRITGFQSGIDRLQFQGYGKLNVPQIVGESRTTMHLSDGTTVVIVSHR